VLDFNSSATFSERVTAFIDEVLARERAAEPPRHYLGASRIGHACGRALQYEYAQAPVDPGRELSGRVIRVFEVGHALEDLAVRWLRLTGFDLYTRKRNGEPFGFSVAGGRIQGHVDGILNGGPNALGLAYPALWECKTMNDKAWRETSKHGVAKAKPIYAAQVAIYQAYMEGSIPGISQPPAFFTGINKDSQELYFESVPFDGGLAQRISDRAVRILQATEAGELLPRIATTPTHQECKVCPWQDPCWRN
jgi:hypothetical protein